MEARVRMLIKDAMKDKNEAAKLTYRSILENAQKIAKNDGNRAVTDDDFIKAAKNEIKQLNDLYEYVKNDSVRATEIAEKVGYCQGLLPQADISIALSYSQNSRNVVIESSVIAQNELDRIASCF